MVDSVGSLAVHDALSVRQRKRHEHLLEGDLACLAQLCVIVAPLGEGKPQVVQVCLIDHGEQVKHGNLRPLYVELD